MSESIDDCEGILPRLGSGLASEMNFSNGVRDGDLRYCSVAFRLLSTTSDFKRVGLLEASASIFITVRSCLIDSVVAGADTSKVSSTISSIISGIAYSTWFTDGKLLFRLLT